MFSPQSPTRTNIEEANKHLQLLHGRISELEATLQSQADEFRQREDLLGKQLSELSQSKNAQIADLEHKLEISENRVRVLTNECKQKDSVIEKLHSRSQALDDILQFQPILEKLVSTMSKSTSVTMRQDQGDYSQNHMPHITQAPDSDVSSLSCNGRGDGSSMEVTSDHSPQKTQRGRSNSNRHFSISEDDADDDLDRDEVMRRMKREMVKELYL